MITFRVAAQVLGGVAKVFIAAALQSAARMRHVPARTLDLLDHRQVHQDHALAVHQTQLAVLLPRHGEVVRRPVGQVQGHVQLVLAGEHEGGVEQLPGQIDARLPGRGVELRQRRSRVGEGGHSAARPQVLGERPALVLREGGEDQGLGVAQQEQGEGVLGRVGVAAADGRVVAGSLDQEVHHSLSSSA